MMDNQDKRHSFEFVMDFSKYIAEDDIRKTRILSAIGYFLFFVPLVFHGDSQNARFHINQSVLNLVLSTIFAIVLGLIPYVGPYLLIVQEALCLVWAIRGFILALMGKARAIPLVGRITIIAYRLPGQV